MSNSDFDERHAEYLRRILAWIDHTTGGIPEGVQLRRMLFVGEFTVHRPFERGFNWVVRREVITRHAHIAHHLWTSK